MMSGVPAAAENPSAASRPAGERRRGRRRKREQARADVLRSALELAESAPFCEVTVDEVARAAGISRSAFYTHFADKHELLLAALGEVESELRRMSERWWRGEGAPAERVRAAIEGFVSVYAEQASLLRIVTEVSTYDEQLRTAWLAITQRLIEATTAHLRAEQRAGLIADLLDPRASAEGLVWMIERCCYVYLARGERSPRELVDDLAPVWTAALYPGVIPAEQLSPGAVAAEEPASSRRRPHTEF